MFGIHSIEYDGLQSYFYVFGALKDGIQWMDWDELCVLARSTNCTSTCKTNSMLEYIMCVIVIHILPILFTVFIFQTSSTSGQVSMWYVLTLYHNTVST